MVKFPSTTSSTVSSAAASSTYRLRSRRASRGAPCSRRTVAAAPTCSAARRTCASPRRVVRRVSSTGESHCTSQKGTSAPAHRFTTRSGQPLSIWTST